MPLKFENKKLQERFEKITPEFKAIMRKRFETAEQISLLLKEKGITQRELAAKLNKSESEISKWLSGTHNLTTDTVALIEFHLGKNTITVCPKDIKPTYIYLFAMSPETAESAIPIKVPAKINNQASEQIKEQYVFSNQNESQIDICAASN